LSTYVVRNGFIFLYTQSEVVELSEMQLNSIIVGKSIAQFRSNKGVTQEVLSGLSNIARSHLSAIENGERKPTLETLYRISRALDVNMSDIVIEIEKGIGCT